MRSVLTASVLALILLAGQAFGMSPMNVPAVPLTDGNGVQITADQIGKGTTVLLVLVRKHAAGTEKLLSYLNGLHPPLPSGRIHIVIGGADDKLLGTMMGRFKDLSTAVWYRDQDELLVKRMNVPATPVVMGVRNAIASWSVVGMPDEKNMEGVLRSWLVP